MNHPALGSCCSVLMDDSLVGDAINDRLSGEILCFGSCLVARFDRLANLLDRGSEGRCEARIVLTTVFCLTRAFARLSCVCHVEALFDGCVERAMLLIHQEKCKITNETAVG